MNKVSVGPYYSPLRYPGGKRKLATVIQSVFEANGFSGRHYIEPYCGGAAVALAVLFSEHAQHVHINDLSRSVFAFWFTVLRKPEELCSWINTVPVTMDEWHRQREIQDQEEAPLFELACATFFLNRTNRSGILKGGVIGGKDQRGNWKLDARFNRKELIKRVQRIARYRDRISLYNLDANVFLRDVHPCLPPSLTYLDPPYFSKGDGLYRNYYTGTDHRSIAKRILQLGHAWIVTYDYAPEIMNLYRTCHSYRYSLSYSAQRRFRGQEVMFLSKDLRLPLVERSQGKVHERGAEVWRVGSIHVASDPSG